MRKFRVEYHLERGPIKGAIVIEADSEAAAKVKYLIMEADDDEQLYDNLSEGEIKELELLKITEEK